MRPLSPAVCVDSLSNLQMPESRAIQRLQQSQRELQEQLQAILGRAACATLGPFRPVGLLRDVQPAAGAWLDSAVRDPLRWTAIALMVRGGARCPSDGATLAAGGIDRVEVTGTFPGRNALIYLTVQKNDLKASQPVPDPIVLPLRDGTEETRLGMALDELMSLPRGPGPQRELEQEKRYRWWYTSLQAEGHAAGIRDLGACRRDVARRVFSERGLQGAATVLRHHRVATTRRYAAAVIPPKEAGSLARSILR